MDTLQANIGIEEVQLGAEPVDGIQEVAVSEINVGDYLLAHTGEETDLVLSGEVRSLPEQVGEGEAVRYVGSIMLRPTEGDRVLIDGRVIARASSIVVPPADFHHQNYNAVDSARPGVPATSVRRYRFFRIPPRQDDQEGLRA